MVKFKKHFTPGLYVNRNGEVVRVIRNNGPQPFSLLGVKEDGRLFKYYSDGKFSKGEHMEDLLKKLS